MILNIQLQEKKIVLILIILQFQRQDLKQSLEIQVLLLIVKMNIIKYE